MSKHPQSSDVNQTAARIVHESTASQDAPAASVDEAIQDPIPGTR